MLLNRFRKMFISTIFMLFFSEHRVQKLKDPVGKVTLFLYSKINLSQLIY